jgi:hypothetical protein
METSAVAATNEAVADSSTAKPGRLKNAALSLEVKGPRVATFDPREVERSRLESEHPCPLRWRQSISKSEYFGVGL